MRKTYKYVIELSKPVWPRHIVDELSGEFEQLRGTELICVKDLQVNNAHAYQRRPRRMKNWFSLVRRQLTGV